MRAPLLIVAAVLALVALHRSARAEPVQRSRVAVIEPRANDPALADVRRRLRAELTANGFEVVDGSAREDPRVAVEAALEECDAVAAFAVIGIDDGSEVDVWLSDAVTHKTLVRRFVGGTSEETRLDPSLLAIHAVELLRASLVELVATRRQRAEGNVAEHARNCVLGAAGCPDSSHSARVARAPEQNRLADYLITAPAAEPVARRPFRIGAGLAIGWVRALGVQAGPTASLGYVSDARLGARVSLVGPLFGGYVEGDHGWAEVRELEIGLAATYQLSMVADLLYLEPYLSAGGQEVYAEGGATAPYEATDETRWAAAFGAGVRLSLWLDTRFAFEIGAHGAVTIPAIDLRIADEPIAIVDRPALRSTLGVVFAP
ncbi:MAG: hypothetical protein JRI23_35615 [Deltaproteobacteria bacterium]|jgi:hypothetical protein|nr:hypothetical protein [Deltaproteobacteria bacterium]MBW2537659.1 hypothetical protein [Deltaproteobacteria bacterium]